MSFPVQAFIDSLTQFSGTNLFNPWRDVSDADAGDHMPAVRRRLLAQHLDCPSPRAIFVNDTNNFYGSRQTGVPMTSEYLILNGRIPRLYYNERMTNTPGMSHDPAAGTFWQFLNRSTIADQTLCWDLLPFQPFRPSTGLNRTPEREEYDAGYIWLQQLLIAHEGVPVVAIGARVRDMMRRYKLHADYFVRHPSRGGINDARDAIDSISGRTATPA
jgi:hypothetical protein